MEEPLFHIDFKSRWGDLRSFCANLPDFLTVEHVALLRSYDSTYFYPERAVIERYLVWDNPVSQILQEQMQEANEQWDAAQGYILDALHARSGMMDSVTYAADDCFQWEYFSSNKRRGCKRSPKKVGSACYGSIVMCYREFTNVDAPILVKSMKEMRDGLRFTPGSLKEIRSTHAYLTALLENPF